ncbi:MAG: hypothetical protein AAFU67_13955, partial [Bacteroidota bacterium]
MHRFTLLLTCLLPLALAAQNDQPFLTLDLDMHNIAIRRLDTDAAGNYVLTCSKDKTAKLWGASTGKLIQTYRPPMGKGYAGMLYAAAIDPNGKYVALGGWSESRNHSIYIFNTQSGILVHRIAGLENII